MKNILYLTYTGMTDPLGQSQVLPYITNLADHGYDYKLVSFEKPDKFKENKSIINGIIKNHPIEWHPLSYSSKYPIISKLYDLLRMYKKTLELCQSSSIDLLHCRSYQAAYVAEKIKKKLGIPYLFDVRGFWVDERVDGGIWNKKNILYNGIFNFLKKIEGHLIHDSDAIVCLTEAGKTEIKGWDSYADTTPIYVIPCSVDLNLFDIPSSEEKKNVRQELNFNHDDFVISYLGSLGTWYMLDEMLLFFKELKKTKPLAKFLFISGSNPDILFESIKQFDLSEEDFQMVRAPRKKVPYYLAASDISLFFIKQSYSKIASSPTKLGEILSMGIPVICNDKVGDVDQIVATAKAGIAISDFNTPDFQSAISRLDSFMAEDPLEIRNRIQTYYDLERAIKTYREVYKFILK